MLRLKVILIYSFSCVFIAGCVSEVDDKIQVNEINKSNIQTDEYVVEQEVCVLDIGRGINKTDLIGKYNLSYGYFKSGNCYKKSYLAETKEGFGFSDSSWYQMLTFNKDSTIDIGEGRYSLIGEDLTLTYYTSSDSKSNREKVSQVFKLTAKTDTIYFQKRDLEINESLVIYEYVRFE